MFLCKRCLQKNYEPVMFLFDSTGNCEICKNINRCADIPSYFLKKRIPIKEKIGDFDDKKWFENPY